MVRKIVLELGGKYLDASTKRALTILEKKGIIDYWFRVSGELRIRLYVEGIREIVKEKDKLFPEIVYTKVKRL